MPTVSVIIPVYNVEAYLHPCVDSVLAQTYSDYEIIMVDDGSPDSCGAICDEYAAMDPRIRVIHQENGGLSAARNAGVNICTGDYVMFLDSDDMIHPQTLEILEYALRKTGSGISMGSFSREYEIVFSRTYTPEKVAVEELDWERASLRFSEIQFITSTMKLIPKSVVNSFPFPPGRKHEDEFTTYRYYYSAQTICAVDLPLYYYRPNPAGIMATEDLKSCRDRIDALCEKSVFFEGMNLPEFARKIKESMAWWTAEYAILARSQKKKNDLPKSLRVPVPLALRRMKHNTSHQRFLTFFEMAYPRLSKLFLAFSRKT